MELIYFKSLLTLYELGNYSKTADVLGYSQSSISTHIQRLEQIYKGKIICRKGTRLVLTLKGKIVYQYAKKIVELMEVLNSKLQTEEVNKISIGTIESIALYYLQDIIEAYKIKYPQVIFNLSIKNETELLEKLAQQKLDFVLLFNKEVKIAGIKSLNIKAESLCFIYNPNSNTENIILNELENQSLILTEKDCPYRKALLADFEKQGQRYKISMELSNVDTIKNLVSNNWGIGFVPQYTIKPNDNFGVIKYKLSTPFYIQLLYYSELEDNIQYRDFLKIVTSSIYG